MISSIVIAGKHNVNVNEYGKFYCGDTLMSVKDVPFVRYRFKYDNESKEYIERTNKKFPNSVHLMEFRDEWDAEQIRSFEEAFPDMPKFLYVSVEDREAEGKELSIEKVIKITEVIQSAAIDRVMLIDNTTCLDMVTATAIIDKLGKTLRYPIKDIGICSSPLSFADDMCCLSAVRAREIAANYYTGEDFALPTAKHQSMNCCGCIRYYLVKADTKPVLSSKRKVSGGFMNEPDGNVDDAKEKKSKTPAKKKKYSTDFSRLAL